MFSSNYEKREEVCNFLAWFLILLNNWCGLFYKKVCAAEISEKNVMVDHGGELPDRNGQCYSATLEFPASEMKKIKKLYMHMQMYIYRCVNCVYI